jgi:glycosyltransferase involved in cell wall biosynthesis
VNRSSGTESSALVVAAHPPGGGSGSGLRGRVALNALRARFDVVDVVAFATPGEETLADPAALLLQRPAALGTAARIAAVRYGGAYYAPEKAAGRRRLRDLVAESRIRHEYDVLWVCQSLLARAALAAVRANSAVLDIDNVAGADRRRSASDRTASSPLRAFRLLSAVALAREERARCDEFDMVTLPSELERSRLGAIRSPVTIVPNTIAPGPAARPGAAPARLLFVGSLDYEPNIDAVRSLTGAILPAVRAEVPEAQLTIAGRNPSNEVVELCAAAGVDLAADAPSLDSFYASTRLVVAPLRLGGGTRFKIIEAMSRGAAIVATPTAVEGLLVDSGRDVLVAEDPATFARNCVRLLREPSVADALGAAARETWFNHYRPEVARAAIDGVLNRLLKDD